MAAFLLDTNHASRLVTLDHPLRARILKQIDDGDSFAICVPVLTEMLFGLGMLPRAALNLSEWQRLRPQITCHIPDETDAESAAHLQVSLRRRGWQLETVDALISALALRYDLILLTTDKDFRSVPELQLDNWVEYLTR